MFGGHFSILSLHCVLEESQKRCERVAIIIPNFTSEDTESEKSDA